MPTRGRVAHLWDSLPEQCAALCTSSRQSSGSVCASSTLYRLNFAWKLPGLAPFPVAVWLVECSPKSWILIDAGTSSAGNQQAILQGLNTTLSTQDTLRLILGQTSAIAAALAI